MHMEGLWHNIHDRIRHRIPYPECTSRVSLLPPGPCDGTQAHVLWLMQSSRHVSLIPVKEAGKVSSPFEACMELEEERASRRPDPCSESDGHSKDSK